MAMVTAIAVATTPMTAKMASATTVKLMTSVAVMAKGNSDGGNCVDCESDGGDGDSDGSSSGDNDSDGSGDGATTAAVAAMKTTAATAMRGE